MQSRQVAEVLSGIDVTEMLCSPLLRAVETAETIAAPHHIEVARDPRLTNIHVGRWEGRTYADLDDDADYQAFVCDPLSATIPGGETLTAMCDRMVSSVSQALEDNQIDSNIVMVTHAGPIRVVLAHFMGVSLACYHRLRVAPGAVTVLRFSSDLEPPRVVAINFGGTIEQLLS